MIFIIPAWSRQASAPPITIGLVALNILLFLVTWPLQSNRQGVASRDQYQVQAQSLAHVLLKPESGLSEQDRAWLEAEQSNEGFPTPASLELFQRVERREIILTPAAHYNWSMQYPLFQSMERSVALHHDTSTPFERFGLKANRWFPGLLTHMFLHAGWLHLFFNMLFLWTAGLVLESAIGLGMLGIYLAGGFAAAAAQLAWGVSAADVMVGASGAIAALMGFALFAMPSARIHLFYAHILMLVPRGGTFESPLWFIVPLWLAQQVFMLLMPLTGELANVGYAAHVGGFVFGGVMGLVARAFGWSSPSPH